ncbi:MAG: hypothetical protein KGR24_10030, partial [Planctomycetes bacterium]|nr:hypothetical protein [Planctomycetota bacterium]
MATLLSLQGGACSGNTMSFLSADEPIACNRIPSNRQSSMTRAGMPRTGCTAPEHPFYDLMPGTVHAYDGKTGR